MAADNSEVTRGQGGLQGATRTTLAYLAVGFGLLATGWAVQPRFQGRQVTAEMQEVLFPKLTDAAQAGSLEIISYDEELAELSPFKVVKTGGVWVLPAHENYPADAKEHLAAAATELIDLKALDVVSTSPAEHETFGVIEPDPEKIEAGMTGVGKLVEIRDEAGATLARLVVGKEDRQPAGAGGGTRLLRFVRKAGQDPVYRVEIDTSKFTTRFDDWIEKDLLGLSPWDVRRVLLDDYTLAAVQAEGRLMVEQQRKSKIELAYDDREAAWSLDTLAIYDPKQPGAKPTIAELAVGEEIDTAKLNDLRNALGDLKIIDVVRKPAGLTADLAAEASFLEDDEAVTSLQQRGFLPLSSGEILSTDGETVVGMKDGVEYVLRFGVGTSVAQAGSETAVDGGERSETPGRYLLVMARFNENLLEKPTLDPLPDASAEDPAAEAGDSAASEKTAGEESAVSEEPAAPQEGGDAPERSANAEPAASGSEEPPPVEPAADEGAADERSRPFRLVARQAADASAAAADETAADETAADEQVGGDEPPADTTPPASVGGEEADEAPPSPPPSAAEALKSADEQEAKAQAAREERRRVERENRRKQDEYDEKVDTAKKRVRELNGRFAAWYYIVSDTEYAKIHLSREDVIRAKPTGDEGSGAASAIPTP